MEKSYFCQECRKTFLASELKEVEMPKNFKVSTPKCAVYEKDGKQYVPGCPHCDNVFFFLSLNEVKKEELNAKTDAK